MAVKTISSEDLANREVGYYIAKEVKAQLMKSHEKVTSGNQDRIYVIDGREGLGKSTLAIQLAYFLDPEFNVNQIVFNSYEFENLIRNLPRYRSVIFDEAFNGLSSKGSLSRENKNLVRMLMECRQRNLFIFIVLPSIFLLEKYAAIFRSQGLFHVVSSRTNYKSRSYSIFNYNKKKLLYIKGKSHMSYSWPRVPKSYRFYGKYPPNFDLAAYNKKKLSSFNDTTKKETKKNYDGQRNLLIKYIYENCNLSLNQISELFKNHETQLSKSQIGRIVNDGA